MVEYYSQGKVVVIGDIMAHCHFVYQKSHVGWPSIIPGPPAVTERLAVIFDSTFCDGF